MTDSTPPCLILSLIFIFLVSPNLVWILAVRLELSFWLSSDFFLGFHSCLAHIVLHPTTLCRMLFAHPGILCRLWVLCFWFLWSFVSGLWGGPLWSILVSHRLGPLWYWRLSSLFHWWFSRRPFLYCWLVLCLFHLSIFLFDLFPCIVLWFLLPPSSDWCTFSIISLSISLVCLFASMNSSFGILSGPRLLFLFSFFIAWLNSFSLILSSGLLFIGGSSSDDLTCSFIFFVQSA